MEILIAKGGGGEWSCDLWSEGMLMLFNSVFLSSFFFLFLSFENEREREREYIVSLVNRNGFGFRVYTGVFAF